MYLFPYKQIEKNAKVVIYGMGNVGKDYIKQLKSLNYAELLFVVDQELKYCNKFMSVAVGQMEDIKKRQNEIDYIVISILNKNIRKKVYDSFLKEGIEKKKLVLAEDNFVADMKFSPYHLRDLEKTENYFSIFYDFFRNGEGEVHYFENIIEEVKCQEENKNALCIRLIENTSNAIYKIIIIRIFMEAGSMSSCLLKLLVDSVSQIPNLETRYMLLTDIAILPVYFGYSLYKEFYQDMAKEFKRLIKQFQLVKPEKKQGAHKKRVAVILNSLYGEFGHGDFKKNILESISKKYEVCIFCLETRSWYSGISFIRPFDSLGCEGKSSKMFSEQNNKLIDGIATISYVEGNTVKERMQKSIDMIFEYNPALIVDFSDEMTPQTYLFENIFDVLYIPMRGFPTSMYCTKKLVEGMRAALYCNEMFPSVKKETFADAFMLVNIPNSEINYSRDRFGWKKRDFIMVTVGARLNYEMSQGFIDGICEMLMKDSDIKWLLVGVSSIDYLMNKYEDLLNNGQIVFHEYEKNLIGIFRMVDIYLNPKRTGGGISQLWAASVGVPIIADGSLWFDEMETLGWNNLCWNQDEQIEKILRMKKDYAYREYVQKETKKAYEIWVDRTSREEVMDVVQEMIE